MEATHTSTQVDEFKKWIDEAPPSGGHPLGGCPMAGTAGGVPSNTDPVTTSKTDIRKLVIPYKYPHAFKIDYLRFTVYENSVNEMLVRNLLGCRIESKPTKLYNCKVWHRGEWDEAVNAFQGEKYWVWDLPGSSRCLSDPAFWVMLDGLLNRSVFRINVTRIDVTLDQFLGTILPWRFPFQVRDSHLNNDMFITQYECFDFKENQIGAMLRANSFWRDDPWGERVAQGELGHWVHPSEETFYLGKRGVSDYMLRCYDLHGPLRWEWEVAKLAALPLTKRIAGEVAAGEKLGEVIRRAWIGISNKQISCDLWDKLGVGVTPDPIPVEDTTIVKSISRSVEQYASLHVAIADNKKTGVYIAMCRNHVARMSRMGKHRAKKTFERVRDGGELLWAAVENTLLEKRRDQDKLPSELPAFPVL